MRKKSLPKELINSRGNAVDIELVRPEHLKKHLMVETTFAEIDKLLERMVKTKTKIIGKALAYLEWQAKRNHVEDPKWEDVSLSNYPTTMRILIKNNTQEEFDEHLQLARKKIDECLDEWTEGVNVNIKAIIDRAFKTGKKGFIDRNNIKGLFQLNIKHPKWIEAMELIRKSITETGKKEYIMFQKRIDQKAEFKTINLNFSSLDVEAIVRKELAEQSAVDGEQGAESVGQKKGGKKKSKKD